MTNEQYNCLMIFHNRRSPVIHKVMERYFLDGESVGILSIDYGLNPRSIYNNINPLKKWHEALHTIDLTQGLSKELIIIIMDMLHIKKNRMGRQQILSILIDGYSINDVLIKSYSRDLPTDIKQIKHTYKLLCKVEW